MELHDLRIVPHPAGNRITISWLAQPAPEAGGLRIVRRERSHPRTPDDGVLVAEIALPLSSLDSEPQQQQVDDRGLRAETVYYYTLFPFIGPSSEGGYLLDRARRLTAMATGPYGFGEQLYQLLPAIYKRYDEPGGQLRRFLELVGGQFDELYSLARSLHDIHDLERVDGRLLPLLAQTLDWPINQRLSLDEQRVELRQAPYIYQRMGIIATVEAMIKRLIGWESRVKEFVDNIFCTNQPEQMLLRMQRIPDQRRTDIPSELLSLDGAPEGRPAALRDRSGRYLLIYQTLDTQQLQLRSKHSSDGVTWSPSVRIAADQSERRPALAEHASGLWLFCEAVDLQSGCSRIAARRFIDDRWVAMELPDLGSDQQFYPQVLVDANDRLWLFWIAQAGPLRRLCFCCYEDGNWSRPTVVAPAENGAPPDRDLFVLAGPEGSIWVCGARREQLAASGQSRRRITWRVKASADPALTNDWSPQYTLWPIDHDADECEPALLQSGAQLELYWSSNRDGSRSIWRTYLNSDPALAPSNPEMLTGNPFNQSAPLPLRVGDTTLLMYRSNESLRYTSPTYSATETVDQRYAGATTVDVRNQSKLALRGRFSDFQTYTYDGGDNGMRNERNWYARDTVGIYLTPDTEDPARILGNRHLVEGVLRGFLPIQVRTVFIIESPIYRELVYTYVEPEATPRRFIEESSSYRLNTPMAESYRGLSEDTQVDVPTWRWLRTWSTQHSDQRTLDTAGGVRNLEYRTWYGLVDQGGEDGTA